MSLTNKQLSTTEYEAKIKTLSAELEIAKTANVEIQNVNDNLAKRVEAIELQTRTERIANIVSGAYNDNVDEKITAFVKSGLSTEEILKIVAPLKSSRTKSASYTSTVAIKNESVKNNGWQDSFLDIVGGNA